MAKNKNFKQGQIVRFKNKSRLFDLEKRTELVIPKGTTAIIILDQDAGEIGSCKVKLKKKDGSFVIAETDDKNLEVQK